MRTSLPGRASTRIVITGCGALIVVTSARTRYATGTVSLSTSSRPIPGRSMCNASGFSPTRRGVARERSHSPDAKVARALSRSTTVPSLQLCGSQLRWSTSFPSGETRGCTVMGGAPLYKSAIARPPTITRPAVTRATATSGKPALRTKRSRGGAGKSPNGAGGGTMATSVPSRAGRGDGASPGRRGAIPGSATPIIVLFGLALGGVWGATGADGGGAAGAASAMPSMVLFIACAGG
jgi:hypothetical protein